MASAKPQGGFVIEKRKAVSREHKAFGKIQII